MLPGVTIFDGVPENDGDVFPALPSGTPDGPGEVFDGTSVDDQSDGGGDDGLGTGGTINPPTPPPPIPKPLPKDILELFCAPCPLSKSGVHQFFSQLSVASGGIQPYSYSIVQGAVPDGTTLLTDNGTLNNSAIVFGQTTVVEPYSYTVRVTDSTGIVSVTPVSSNGSGISGYTNLGPFDGVLGSITTPADDQLLMMICITGRDVSGPPVFNEVTSIATKGGSSLTFTRIFHDTFTYSDAAADGALPVACISIDIFTAPAPTQITAGVGWQGQLSITSDFSNHMRGTVALMSIGGLKDLSSPFDPVLTPLASPSPGPNVASNTSGTASVPTNHGVDTSSAADALFALTINHDFAGSDAAAVAPPGWLTIANLNNPLSACGFNLMLSYQNQTTIQTGATIAAGFSDNYWYQFVFGLEGTGGSPLSAEQIVSGNISDVVPGTATITSSTVPSDTAQGGEALFHVPTYNTLHIEVFGGSATGTQLASTFGLDLGVGPNGHAVYDFTPATPGAPVDDGTGVMPYVIGTGSPSGEIIFTWK